MAVNSKPRLSRLTRWLEGKTSGGIINFAIIPLLLIASLLLPPISAAQRVADLGTTRITAEGGAIGDPDGTQVVVLPGAASQPFRANHLLRASRQLPGRQRGRGSGRGRPRHPGAPGGQKPLLSIEAERANRPRNLPGWSPFPNDSEPYETLDLYTWDATSKSWQWLPHNIISEDDQIESHTPTLPTSVMVMQTNPEPAQATADLALANQLPQDAASALAEIHPTGLYLGGNGE